jgi:allophanate hydrolase
VRVDTTQGVSIQVETYELTADAFGRFVAAVPPPLCIGTVDTLQGPVAGFLCEPIGVNDAVDISSYGGWRAYRGRGG